MKLKLLTFAPGFLLAVTLAAQPAPENPAAPADQQKPADAGAPATPADPSAPDDGQEPQALLGTIADGRYHSPTGAFDVAIPKIALESARVIDNPEIVVFRDDVATMVTIASFALPALDKWELETTSAREYLIKFFREYVLSDYLEAFPETTVESARLINGLEGGSLLVNTLHPGGSAFPTDPIVRDLPDSKPVAKRGNLLFCRDDRVYVVSTELADRATEMSTYVIDSESEDKILRERLLDIHENMHFTNSQPHPSPVASAAP